jgi:hypothetical protein
MERANARQLSFLENLKKSGDEQHDEWVAREQKGDEDASDSHLSKVQLAQAEKYQRFVYRIRSRELRELTECLEAGWIERWPEGPKKYAITESGLTQLKIAGAVDSEEEDDISE